MKRLSLTPKRQEQLERQLRQTRDAGVYRRTLAVLEYGRGVSVSQVARTLHVTRRSVYRWIEAYGERHVPAALGSNVRCGRPSVWSDEHSVWLEALLAYHPERFGFSAANWTVPLLQRQMQDCVGEWFSEESLRQHLRRLGYAWKRARYVLAPDPDREKKTPNPPRNPGSGAAPRLVG